MSFQDCGNEFHRFGNEFRPKRTNKKPGQEFEYLEEEIIFLLMTCYETPEESSGSDQARLLPLFRLPLLLRHLVLLVAALARLKKKWPSWYFLRPAWVVLGRLCYLLEAVLLGLYLGGRFYPD